MTRKPVDNTDSNACDQSTIVNESPTISGINAHLQCTTTSITSGSYTAISIAEYCTDFSTLVDSNSGRISTVENITTGSTFCVAFQGTAWIGLQSSNCGSSGRKQRKTKPNPGSSGTTTQRITALATTGATCYSAGAGPDGLINTPPVATVISPIEVSINALADITVPVIDAIMTIPATLDECGDVCQGAPSSVLGAKSCTLAFNSTGKVVEQSYAVTIMVEDFYGQGTYIHHLLSFPFNVQFML
ncbi:unnamed protein product [Rotaria magnacalcarata]|uniref:Uncharacterized protein n=1 Tax=Rotaria magnacalcarata TaxID=392030 RepID=A0A8S2V6M2_9BILA|nr:unnamed protein product [Rotaria magnacalcarata]